MKRLIRQSARSIEIYTYDELSNEAKEKALKEFNNYYQEHICYDLVMEEFALAKMDGCGCNERLKEIGIPTDDIEDIHFDWIKAWLVGEVDVEDFIKSANLSLVLSDIEWDILDYIFKGLLSFTDMNIEPYTIEIIEEYFMEYIYEEPEDITEDLSAEAFMNALDKFKEEHYDNIKHVVDIIIEKFEYAVDAANKELTEIMDSYNYPSNEFLEEEIEINEIEFLEDGRIYK